MRTVWLAVEVKAPDKLEDESVAGYLAKFMEVGWCDLHDTIKDPCLEHTEEDKLALSADWGGVFILPDKP